MAIHLVRHAAAGRHSHDADDLNRRLDQTGLHQAEGLGRYFAELPVRAVWSSEATRCVQTVGPAASMHGLVVETYPELTEGASAGDFIEMLESQAESPDDLVMCSHGDLIPEVLNTLLRRGMAVVGPKGCGKGSVWTLQTRGSEIVSATYDASPWVIDPQGRR